VPVAATLGQASDLAGIVAAATAVVAAEPRSHALRIGVQIRTTAKSPWSRKEIWERVGPALASAYTLDTRWPEWVLSIIADEEVDIGFAPVALHLSPWAGGARHFAHDGDAMSRAEYKLVEACEVFGLEPAGPARAVDLGAAPGGWTRHLAQRGLEVTAVDPAQLDPRVMALPNVRHARMRAENFVTQQPPASIDWLVNDMRIDAFEAAQLLVGMRSLLAPNGVLVTTLKLPRNRAVEAMRRALGELASAFRIDGVKQLFHNRSEVTVVARMQV
jgi:23S rRNA (cytidine2498-2'-O)-methyltransferase